MKRIALIPLVALALGACSEIQAPEMSAQFTDAPTQLVGYLPSWTSTQVCQALDTAPEGWLPGTDGKFETDEPESFTKDGFTFTLWDDGGTLKLNWMATGTNIMKAVVVKGGPDLPLVYLYNPPAATSATGLVGPVVGTNGNPSGVSHFHYCWMPGLDMGEGCTIGYWKNTRAFLNVDDPRTETLGDALGIDGDYAGYTLRQALDFGGGPGIAGAQRILLRQAAAAYLNILHGDIAYALELDDLLAAIAEAWGDRADMLELAEMLDAYNNAGCPIDNWGRLITE
jgi:hypothetical protein